ncbi:glutaredoxin domain-containing protein [Sorangium sp. So ce513]|uniref:glutaredoxin domain-containing protein n=1 Tax=Sorangium sp. So ce513 TaxID=3133315 RepID=UPI003F61D662
MTGAARGAGAGARGPDDSARGHTHSARGADDGARGPAHGARGIMAARACRAAALLAIAAAALGPAACTEKRDDGTTPAQAPAELPPLELRDDTANLMLTWIDEKGDTHVELRPADVPAEGRSMVRAMLSDRTEGTRDVFYVADLTQKRPDGTYAVRTMPRREWESLLEKRRAEHLAKTAPPPPPVAPGGSAGAGGPAGPGAPSQLAGVTVIIYGASWCKPCHQAADYLRAKGVAAIVKDIEEDPAAAAEMQDKLAKSHQRGGSIPIIDVRGQILVGFSPHALDQALARAARGTTL